MPVLGFMPLGGSRVLDIGQIRCYLGFLPIILMLKSVKLGAMGKTTVSFNKDMAHSPFWIWQFLVLLLSSAGQGGEGRRHGGVLVYRFRGWHGKSLRVGDPHMVAFIAAMILG
jgi:hypothetical protein